MIITKSSKPATNCGTKISSVLDNLLFFFPGKLVQFLIFDSLRSLYVNCLLGKHDMGKLNQRYSEISAEAKSPNIEIYNHCAKVLDRITFVFICTRIM